jgi:hypothetical protein
LSGDGNNPADILEESPYDFEHKSPAEHGDMTWEGILLDPDDHVYSMGIGVENPVDQMHHDGKNTAGTAAGHSYDPMLNEEVASTNGSWRFGAKDHRRNLDQPDLTEGDYFEELDLTLRALSRPTSILSWPQIRCLVNERGVLPLRLSD